MLMVIGGLSVCQSVVGVDGGGGRGLTPCAVHLGLLEDHAALVVHRASVQSKFLVLPLAVQGRRARDHVPVLLSGGVLLHVPLLDVAQVPTARVVSCYKEVYLLDE
jgi:hypothetical protein